VSLPVTESELALKGRGLLRGLTALTPDDLSVMRAYRAEAGFSARFDALSRTYRYRISTGPARPVLAWDRAWWLKGTLDVEAMSRAAGVLVGEHDFASFCKTASAVGRPTCRYVSELSVGEVDECGERLIAIDVCGNAFLHSMVRTIAGTLVEVGSGRRSVEWVSEALAACDRRAAGPCAPARGLTFVAVDYPSDSLVPWK
jgi:tRNA pseudouridine38-40 synthase